MRLLALETATSVGSVALLDDGVVVREHSDRVPRQHLEWLVPAVAGVLTAAGWTPGDVEAVAVSTGPGSFTSLRIGIATAAMWSRSRGIPAVGVPTLDAVALGTQTPGLIGAILDVRRGEVAFALFRRDGVLQRMTDDRVGSVASVLESLPPGPITFSGDALERYGEAIVGLRDQATFAPRPQWYPMASAVGHLGWERLARGEHDDVYRLHPTYSRAPTDKESAGAQG
ncbi:MAG: tRNA (adenosine(37)-N6)-threonylcarbamoyltransferase complex dimerization subunit type 1 TsaB [Armatimonadetes bacterium 13_1_40CM_64_14]|nr:MAG: tRNA (adenosine(37)-N6)-threonylcarbamoyltransferase complex dimerization subunit type 1 TsaB [Armatimonadetes bacterium 13_1_40CM_64_14]